ncbi:hypothetical protein KQ940_08115 [Marinobacterium sp. D7]|uniref:hypothetical protein n=1 Tax=Marinobacterium ramblicola TaxID=2849041 RepID=UPI001C2CDC21|nr:hypothetical protein [Marinobacterium ramblicola]MBV1788017.1 hypothetical protein [Marinobacterium ramblicola]
MAGPGYHVQLLVLDFALVHDAHHGVPQSDDPRRVGLINRIRQGVSTIGIMLMLALMLLTQSLSLQASVEMVAGDQMGGVLHQRVDCTPYAECADVMSEAASDCCSAEFERHCGSGLCPVVTLGLSNAPILVVPSGGLAPESTVAPLVGTAQSPPYPPPKTN